MKQVEVRGVHNNTHHVSFMSRVEYKRVLSAAVFNNSLRTLLFYPSMPRRHKSSSTLVVCFNIHKKYNNCWQIFIFILFPTFN